jgi:Cu2+-exporting ATPase
MLLLDVGLISVVYLGARLFENYQKKKMQLVNDEKNVYEDKKKDKSLVKINNRKPLSNDKKMNQFVLPVSVASIFLSLVRPFFPVIYPVQMAAMIFISFPIFKMAERSLLEEKKIRAPLLTSVFIISCMAIGQYFAISVTILFYYYAERVMIKTKRELKNRIVDIFDRLPDKVWILREGLEVEIPLNMAKTGDIIIINTGDMVPVDGIITDGTAIIDQHTLTGEFQPSEKTIGDIVFANTVVVTGRIQIKVQQAGSQTSAAKIEEILHNTTEYKSNLYLQGEKWADRLVLPVLGFSAVSMPFVHFIGSVSIMNCSFEARVMMLAPFGTFKHLNHASKRTIFIKDGRALEKAVQVDTILFDKTGTLIDKLPEIGEIFCCNGWDKDTILSYAATAEYRLKHPIALSIVQKAKELNIDFADPDNSDYKIGFGIKVKIDHHMVRVGSKKFILSEGIEVPEAVDTKIDEFHEKGYSVILVAIDQQTGGLIELRPSLRPEMVEIIKGLRKSGIKNFSIVSGDHEKPVQKLAESLGLKSYFAEVLPENKACIVEKLQKQGKTVCFVGDGINDTIAMKKADFSISLNGASTVATDVAQVILMKGTLSSLCELFDISNELNRKSKRTLGILTAGALFNIAGVFLFHFGVITTTLVNISTISLGAFSGIPSSRR